MLHPLILKAKEKAENTFDFYVNVQFMSPKEAELYIASRLDLEMARSEVKS